MMATFKGFCLGGPARTSENLPMVRPGVEIVKLSYMTNKPDAVRYLWESAVTVFMERLVDDKGQTGAGTMHAAGIAVYNNRAR